MNIQEKDQKAKELGAKKKIILVGSAGRKTIYVKNPTVEQLGQVHSLAQKQNAFDAQRFLLSQITVKEVSDELEKDIEAEYVNGAVKQLDAFITPIEGELLDL